MLIDFVKFIHILFALALLGSVIYGLVTFKKIPANNNNQPHQRIDKTLLLISLLAIITGSLLVKPSQFDFHTPWVEAAYTLMFSFSLVVGLLILFSKKLIVKKEIRLCAYIFLIMILLFILHDAVTKTTFLFL